MSEKNLVVCDKELRYATGLGENISLRTEFAFRVHICTSVDSVKQFQEKQKLHILIIDEEFAYEEREQMDAEQTFVLTKGRCQDLGEKEKEIYKYQSADKILAAVFETYCGQKENNLIKKINTQKKKLIAVYSPIHRIGKTTFAIALGRELAKTSRTLYLNLEEYTDVGERFIRAEGKNLSDLLYFMRQEGEDTALRVSTMIAHMGDLEYIPPFLLGADLKEISLEEWQSFLTSVLNETVYETVILDLGESIQGLLEILQFCDKVYTPVLEDGISKQKVQQFEEMLRQMGLSGLEQKIQQFVAVEDMQLYVKRIIQEEM